MLHSGISLKTVEIHVSNVDFYINEFLLAYEPVGAHEGAIQVDNFFNDWFIRKAMWANKTNIKSTAGSLKKFYKFMLQKSLIEDLDYEYLTYIIKNDMSVWLEKMDKYDNYDEDY